MEDKAQHDKLIDMDVDTFELDLYHKNYHKNAAEHLLVDEDLLPFHTNKYTASVARFEKDYTLDIAMTLM